ncbi:hypothetical protein TRFO_06721 [Tritrichomonas foetus]|uniref:WD repeat protein n=1 Tax=Tritrichomonas foetus TaxID=1144522 RepID=A0A1J4JWE4_9EUKA|nr:hypothetical protein TRFO_06721 [Tritrichomonas foetus]|eukprot:OHT03465.1 hypothetical protein TRFO_06721 [Tritrichomonas foetus]
MNSEFIQKFTSMTGTAVTTLEPFSSLGMAGVPNAGPYYINDASIVLPVGNQIIQQSLDTGERSFLLSSRLYDKGPRHTKITAFSVNTEGNILALASTRQNDPPILVLYSIPSGNQIMSFPQVNSSGVHFVAFHRSLKIGLYLTTDPRKFRMNIFDINSKSEIKSIKFTERYEIATFHPHNDSLILLFSPKALGYYKKGDENATLLNVPNYSKFSGFVYSLNETNTCVATSGRDILFFIDMQLKHTLTISEDSPIVYLSSFSHGFIVATESNKLILIQHVPGHKDLTRIFQQGQSISYGVNHPIVWASFSPSGHQMICNVDYRQLIIVNIRELESNTENAIVNPNIISHKGPVASISSCAYKPMLVSCGVEDRTVIIWDYSKQASVLHSEFAENLTDVSFHPSGDLVAVASTDKLYLLAATVDSLVSRANWPLFNCLSIEFSNGGHFLVAASHIITFINPYTQEIIATLRGHTGLIHSLSWSQDDKRLVSSGSDGAICEWNAVTQEQMWSVNIPKCDFESSVITDRGTVIACSKTETIHHLFNGRHQSRISEDMIGFSSVMFATPTTLILGDVLGGIVVVPFPFIVPPSQQAQFENIPQLEFSESQESAKTISTTPIPFLSGDVFRSHCGKVTSICSSLDGRVLFTSSADSSLCIFNVLSSSQTYAHSNIPILRCEIPKQQFFLVSQSRFDELQHAIEKLKRDIQKQRVTYETETIASLQAHNRNMTELTAQQEEKKNKLNQQIENLKEAMDDSTVKAALIYQNMEGAHLNEAKALTNLYEQKLSLEKAKCDSISKELEDLKCSYEERIYLLKQQYKTSLQDFSTKIDQEQNQLTQHLESTKNRINETQENQDRELIDLEMEFEKDRMAINLEYHNRIMSLKKLLNELDIKRTNLKQAIDKQKLDLDGLESELKSAKDKRAELDKEIKALQHTHECRTSELNDRDETLVRQAERLEKLQTSNLELEKNKDIMNFRLEEMSRELQPSNDEIARLSFELNGNSEEIRTIKRFSKANHRTMQDKTHQIEVLKRKLETQKLTLAKKRRIIQMFTADLNDGVSREDVTMKANTLKELHDKYVAVHNLEETLKDANETIDEHTRQRKHLQQSVMLLQRQVNQQQEITTKHFTTKSSENSSLLNDLNRLAKENRTLRKRLDNTKSDVEMLESNLKRVRQAAHEQQMKQARNIKATMGGKQKVMDDWVKQKSRTGAQTQFNFFDSRGKYLHGVKS